MQHFTAEIAAINEPTLVWDAEQDMDVETAMDLIIIRDAATGEEVDAFQVESSASAEDYQVALRDRGCGGAEWVDAK